MITEGLEPRRRGPPRVRCPCAPHVLIVVGAGDVAIKDGLIAEIGTNLGATEPREVDCTGQHLMPGCA